MAITPSLDSALLAQSPEEKERGRRVEINNGRGAMLGILAILLYPVGLLVLCTWLLLFKCRENILKNEHSALSRSIGFLYREYEITFYW